MFLYLSKKISMPNGTKLKALAWNSQQGWLACGGEQGLLKVLMLDTGSAIEENKQRSTMPTASNLSMNQTLEGHHGTVVAVAWNQNYRKLTTSDEQGLVIVWVLHKGMWFEEMINNRNKSVVKDLRWSSDGQKICIAYEDGQVVMGNVDGNRLWGKDVNAQLCLVEWSPDGRLILFCTTQGTCLIYDCNSNYVAELVICFFNKGTGIRIVGIDWYNGVEGYNDPTAPTLALALASGKLQLMRHELDEEPVLIDTRMTTICIKWSPDGEVLAVVGSEVSDSDIQGSMVQLYSNTGIHLRTLHVPGTKTRYCKYVNRLVAVSGGGEHCVLATVGEIPDQYILILCNAIGNPVDSKNISVEPLFVTMNSSYVFIASEDKIFVWMYKGTHESQAYGVDPVILQEHIIHIDDLQHPPDQDIDGETLDSSTDQICCICSSDRYLIVGRESGILHRYHLPTMSETKGLLTCRPQALELNCNSNRLSVIDVNGVLSFYDMFEKKRAEEILTPSSKHASICERVSDFERKDVWDMKWADDNPDLLAVMEKTRMYIFRGTDPEEPVSCTAYLCNFHNLQIQAVHLDEVMRQPEKLGKEHVFNYETKSLRDTRQMLKAVEIQDAFIYVEDHSHPRLWRSLAEYALETLDLSVAEKAFVRCEDFYGIQFVKGLHIIKERNKQKAEICVYFEKFDAAEKLYLEMDRTDLAIDLRIKMGDWFIVEALISRGAGNDSLLELTWNNIGNYYADRQNWSKAATYYAKANNCEKLAECFYALQNWLDLERLMNTLHDGSPLLIVIGQKFASVGICEHAVTCFVRGGDVKGAINCCMELNFWQKAMELSKLHDCEKLVSGTLAKYTSYLLQSGNPLHAVEVYQRAGEHQQAAKILTNLAKTCAKKTGNPLEAKKLFVLAAFEVEAYRSSILASKLMKEIRPSYLLQNCMEDSEVVNSKAATTLEGLLQHDTVATSEAILDNAWHGAEGYHLWLLAQRELYAGHYDQAMKISWWLRNYNDILSDEEIYSLIALTTFYNKNYAHCSQAFVKLESLRNIPQSKQEEITQMALNIFSQYPPISPSQDSTRFCGNCNGPIEVSL
ncbi:hypothetical protein AXG93_4273s1210 [Marchantia polymorpha subsp. ruderalis]|uniref:Uncharacterized protein n=1 Tax=Marchantia polymorpha subsp. ruderalis TaxID=1480154 RepID=A0A176VHM7_MARPO|nr:hypothetical protein AXG93_4273s1210 [Marchantia polymorpha subsp. ruderalis]